MDSPESSRSYMKREAASSDVKSDKAGDNVDWKGGDKKKHRSCRARKSGHGEDAEGSDGSIRRSSGGRCETRRRSTGSSRADSDENDYDSREESRSKQMKQKQEESTLEKLSSWYKDGELDNKQDGGAKVWSKSHGCSEESERKKLSLRHLDHDSSQNNSRSKADKLHDVDFEKTDKDYRFPEKRESSQEKGHGFSDQAKSSRRKWDEVDTVRKSEDSYSENVELINGKASDSKHEISRERSGPARYEQGESTNMGTDFSSDKVAKSNNKEDKRTNSERVKSKSRSESQEICRDGTDRDRMEKPGRQKTPSRYDVAESWDVHLNGDGDEDGSKSRTPERNGRRHQDSENSDLDYDRSSSFKRKELEKDAYRDDRSRGKDDTWSDRNKDRESSRESWKRRQPCNIDKDSRVGDFYFDRNRECDLPRHGRERTDYERPHGRSGGRKDGSRGEAVKTSSNFGISNDNYDVIEIQTNLNDYAKAESVSNFARVSESNQQYDVKSGANDDEWASLHDKRARKNDVYGAATHGEDIKERYADDDYDSQGGRGRGRGQKGAPSGRSTAGQSTSSGGSQPQYGSQDSGSFNRAVVQGVKGNRVGRGGRARPTGRDSPQVMPMGMMGSPFGPLGVPPPGAMQPLNPGMSPAHGPPIPPGVFIPPFSPPIWPGARGVDMNILGVHPGISPVPTGSSGPRFPINMGNLPNPAMYYNQSGPGRGVPLSISSPGFSSTGPMSRGVPSDKIPGAWVSPKSSGAPGKAPSRGEQNDYSQNFVDTGMRPQNFIRELELTNVVEDYPKLRELIQKKDEIVEKSASPPMYYKCDLRGFELSPEFFGTKFDVILVDPPWEEYMHRAPGVADHMEYWTFEEIMNLKIEAIADTPSFIFLWVGDGVGLEQGRQCLKKWGFRRCEDICWVKTNKTNATPGLRHDSHTLFQHSKEHCLMGIKGTVRRSTDGHIIHANIDTDVIIAEEPPYGSTQKPEDMYRIIEHFALGRRRLELFGEDHNIRAGWLTLGKDLSSSNFNAEAYVKNFCDKDGKIWQGGGGRNPPPDAPHLVATTADIEALRPKSPMKNQQQLQQSQPQPVSISLTASNSSNRRAAGNSPQNPTALYLNQEASSSNPSTPVPWGSPLEGFKGREREGSVMPSDDKVFDMHGFNGQPNYLDFESYRQMNLL